MSRRRIEGSVPQGASWLRLRPPPNPIETAPPSWRVTSSLPEPLLPTPQPASEIPATTSGLPVAVNGCSPQRCRSDVAPDGAQDHRYARYSSCHRRSAECKPRMSLVRLIPRYAISTSSMATRDERCFGGVVGEDWCLCHPFATSLTFPANSSKSRASRKSL